MKARIWNHRSWIGETDAHRLRERFDVLLRQAGFGLVGFSEAHFEPHGYTAVWLLAESHFALHTFPPFLRRAAPIANFLHATVRSSSP
jgi:S-adenosylmethionine decarboxylase